MGKGRLGSMITVTTRYYSPNVDSYYEHLTLNVMDFENKVYVSDVLPIFSGAQDFNDISTAGGIESCNATKTDTYVELTIVWRDSAQWLQFAKDHLDTANGLKLIKEWRLRKETFIILNIAKRLCFLLKKNDPLEKKIKLTRIDLIFCFIKGIIYD